MKTIQFPKREDWSELLKRPTRTFKDIETTVDDIFKNIQQTGDEAVLKYTSMFDGADLKDLRVTTTEIENAQHQVSDPLKSAIQLAKSNISKFHEAQKTEPVRVETQPGVTCWQAKKPIQKVGLYIPGGTASLFSTVLMLAVPAKIAGCSEIVLCTPPNKEGKINPVTLYTAELCGINKIFKVGGIQAIGAMTFGTESIPKVYKIFGPGNQYVTVAKQVSTTFDVSIDMPAGPSELLIVADETANPEFVASDLLSQAEHGVDSQVVLVSTDEDTITAVQRAIKEQLEVLPRKEMASKAIENSKFILVKDQDSALELIDFYGPEHFIISTKDDDFYVDNINNAGSVFIGKYTPESAGDYASGTNHTLPTNGYAKQYSGVNLDSFNKAITYQKITEEGIKGIGEAVELMAEAEGLQAHKNAMTLRRKAVENN
ncbi:histidinol dehydrogenase HisD [Psychroflexus torquis ATCC 700755]|uniref:Histidinol dehydrogenase n=1 Tax=Psychroflexus torquis (strain ATCC 700755 / CIP 106069 / ACAM 623) TaxID=313595 RepID=K4IJB4_PSYTT|nr:histidinol dehydrogenase [Psychroflexus torquis]AFU70439.1 histidinol dehydrogenase HisD [Psychroflexus torquis ATCC 700755]